MSQDPRSVALSALARFLVTEVSLGDTLEHVAHIATDAMSGASFSGMAILGDDGNPTTAVFTSEEAPEIDQGQYETGNGPCLEAWRTKSVVRLDDMTAATNRFPAFAQASLQHGVNSTLSLPMIAGDQGVGAFNLYAREERAFTDGDEALGLELASAAAAVLSNARAYWGAVGLSEQLSEAMRSRAVIEQAKGMLMAQSKTLAPDEAFELLRRASQRENVKVRDIAQRIVERKPLASDGL